MAGLITIDGSIVMGNLVFKLSEPNRTADLQLGLFTNTSGLSAASHLADITEPGGASYSRITLTDASWVNTSGILTYAATSFTATVAITGTIYGYFLATQGTTPKLFAYEIYAAPFTFSTGDVFKITPTVTL